MSGRMMTADGKDVLPGHGDWAFEGSFSPGTLQSLAPLFEGFEIRKASSLVLESDFAKEQDEHIRAITAMLAKHLDADDLVEAHLEKYTWSLMPVPVEELFKDEHSFTEALSRYERIK